MSHPTPTRRPKTRQRANTAARKALADLITAAERHHRAALDRSWWVDGDPEFWRATAIYTLKVVKMLKRERAR